MRLSAAVTGLMMIGLLCLAGSRVQETCAVTLALTDSSGRDLPGLVRILDADGNAMEVAELQSRGLGLDDKLPIGQWRVLPGKTVVQLPRSKFTIEAFSGLETDLATKSVDLAGQVSADVSISLTRFYNAASRGLRSANTHLHLMKISREEADRYLREVPRADGLDVLFLSYLERTVADREYISNKYTDGDLAGLTTKTGVVFGNGEEHRHNFSGFGQGFGHVMLLDIKELIQPVSIGPGIMQMGTDGLPLQRGIDTARRDGATVLWCHNAWGVEAIPNFVTGRIDAQNIFDGGVHGSYKNTFYRYLDAGLRVPFSTGTDWFMYDFSRVYAPVKGELTVKSWLAALTAGRSYITNGPFLEFRVADKTLGDTVGLKRPGRVKIEARAVGRVDFGRIEVVRNGKVIAKGESRSVGRHFEAELSLNEHVGFPSWLALRIPPPPVNDDPELQEPVAVNEFGRDLFAHTSPVYVEIGGRGVFDATVARQLLDEMQTNMEVVTQQGKFADEQERERVLDVYRDGIATLRKRIEAGNAPN